VLLVGWDDDYPRENFRSGDVLPAENGAWKIQNSWGPSYGDGGYFYISYEDGSFCANVPGALSLVLEPLESWDGIYSHDPLGQCLNIVGNNFSEYLEASVFEAERDEDIVAAGFITANEDMVYELQIYKDIPAGEGPDAGKPALSVPQTGETDQVGYRAVKLDEPVRVRKGERFAVAVKIRTKDGSEAYLPAEAMIPGYSDNASVSPGQSYVYFDADEDESEEWMDTYELLMDDAGDNYGWDKYSPRNFNVNVKAFTVAAPANSGSGGGCNSTVLGMTGILALVLLVGNRGNLKTKGENFMKRFAGVKAASGIFLVLTAVLWVFCGGVFAGDAAATLNLTRCYYVDDESLISISESGRNVVQPDRDIAFDFSFTNAAETDYTVKIYEADGSSNFEESGHSRVPGETRTVPSNITWPISAGGRMMVSFTVIGANGAEVTKKYTLEAPSEANDAIPDPTITLTKCYYVEDESSISESGLNAVKPNKEIAFEFRFENVKSARYRITVDSGFFADMPLPLNADGTGRRHVKLTIPEGGRAEVVITGANDAGESNTKTYTLRATGTSGNDPIVPQPPTSEDSGGGGCSTGFGLGTLMLLTVLTLKGKAGKHEGK
jgi:hypothetical protein